MRIQGQKLPGCRRLIALLCFACEQNDRYICITYNLKCNNSCARLGIVFQISKTSTLALPMAKQNENQCATL